MCQLGLSESEVGKLHRYFDRDGNGKVNFDEFLLKVRGKMGGVRRKLVVHVFNLLDQAGDGNGALSVGDIEKAYDTSNHPEVKAGKLSAQEALRGFVESFEGDRGNHDGIVTMEEWLTYYEALSSSIDSDDYFGTMMTSVWRDIKTKTADGRLVSAVTFVSAARIASLETMLRKAIYEKHRKTSEARALKETFKSIDTNNNGTVSFDEFQTAMTRYGLGTGDERVKGGVAKDELRALFDKYDAEGSDSLSYAEFAAGLFVNEAQPSATNNTSLPLGGASASAGGVGGAGGGIAPTSVSRPGTAARPGSSHTRGRSMANPAPQGAPGAYTRSSGIFG